MYRNLLLLLILTELVACLPSTPQVIPSPIAFPLRATNTPVPTSPALDFPILSLRRAEGDTDWQPSHLPNLWTLMDRSLITLYFHDRLNDYVHAPNGERWLVGGFGVVRQQPNGEQTWFSIQNGLPVNYFQAIAIAPDGEVWIGGVENALFHFDGQVWHDEGQFLPHPSDGRSDWTCYSQTIFGIDFDQHGQIWVANGGLELYTRLDGHWVDFGFPKDLLPRAGGGGCPYALRVAAPDKITIARHGCCAMPDVVYHFDGRTWISDNDVSSIHNHLARRRGASVASEQWLGGHIDLVRFALPFPEERILPSSLYPAPSNQIALGPDDTLWATNRFSIFRKLPGRRMEDLEVLLAGPVLDVDFGHGRWLDFRDDPVFYDTAGRFQEFSRWLWGKSELGATLLETNYPAELENTGGSLRDISYSLDSQGRVWFYLPGRGLAMAAAGQITLYDSLPDLTPANLGGVQALPDGRVLVGSTGAIWVFQHGRWQKWVIPDTTETFRLFALAQDGTLYAATDTIVYRITGQEYRRTRFVRQEAKPLISEDGDPGLIYHKRYDKLSYPYEGNPARESLLRYKALLLEILPNGNLIFVNNHLMAQFNGQDWRSFLFEQLHFDSAAVDSQGNIWVYAGYNGLLKFDANIFQAYHGLSER